MPLLEIDIEARYAKFQDALSAIQRETKKAAGGMSRDFGSVKTVIAGLGGVVTVGGLAALVKDAIDAADSLKDLSQETGVAVETLGGLGFAAGMAGGTLDGIAAAAGSLNKSIAGAASGNKKFAEGFEALNIDIRDAQGNLKTVDQVLVEIADKFEGYADGPEKVAIATRLLGKAGAEQISLLNEGGRALLQNVEYYKRYSGVTQETADKADQFNDSLAKLNLIGGSFGRTLAAELLPSLNAVADALLRAKENGDGFKTWGERAAGVIKTLTGVAITGGAALERYGIQIGAAAAKARTIADLNFEGLKLIQDGETEELAAARDAYLKLRGEVRDGPPASPLDTFFGKYGKKIEEERELFVSRNQFLDRYRKDDLISEKAYKAAKAGNEKELIENTKVFYSAQIGALQGQKSILQAAGKDTAEVQARIDDLYKKRALVGTEQPRAPTLPGGGDDGSARALDAQLRDLERQNESEQRLLSTRSDFLQSYYQADLLSIKDYYAGRRAAQDEALKAQQANLDKEIAAVRGVSPTDAREAVEQRAKIKELEDRKAALQAAAGVEGIKAFVEEERAARAFAATLESINAELLEQKGLLPEAAAARFDLANEQIKKRITTERDSAVVNGDTAGAEARNSDLAALDSLRERTVAQARLNSIGEIGGRIQGDLSAATERAQIASQQGSMSELESLRVVSDARLQAAADLQQVATAFELVARSSGDPRIIQQARDLQLEVDKLAVSADLVRDRFEDAFAGPFESALEKMIDGTASLKDVLKGLFSDIAGELTRIAAQDFTKQLLSKNGALGGAVDFTSRLFGGATATASPSADIAGSIAKATGAGADTAAATAAAAALATLSATIPLADAGLIAMSASTVAADASILAMSAAAGVAASALASVAGSSAASGAGSFLGGLVAAENGHIFNAGNVVPFAKGGMPGIVNAPMFFPMKDGRTGLMGEAGPEAIMPLKSDGSGRLSVTMIDERGKASLLPVTRDQAGRMAVQGNVKAFASGGVISGGDIRRTARTAVGMQAGLTQAANSTGGEQPRMVVENNFTITGAVNSSSQAQIASAAAKGVDRARRRNT